MSGAVDGTRGKVDEAVVRQAIHWLVRLRSQPADDRLQRACAAWRAEHGEHERAWQQVSALNEELQGRFKALPGGVAYGTLDSSAQRLQRRQALKLLSLLVAGGGIFNADAAERFRCQVVERSAPLLVELSERTGLVADLSILDGDRLLVAESSVPGVLRKRYPANRLVVGQHASLFHSAMGKACLGELADSEVRRLARQHQVDEDLWLRTREQAHGQGYDAQGGAGVEHRGEGLHRTKRWSDNHEQGKDDDGTKDTG